MSPRLLISLFLLGVGVGAPWLVRDWLDARTREGGEKVPPSSRTSAFYEDLVDWTDRWKARFRRDSGKPEEPEKKTAAGEAGLARASQRVPYPLAAKTKRIMEGLFPSSASEGKKIPFFDSGTVPETPRTRLITEEVAERLRGELDPLGLAPGDPVHLRVFKEESELELWMKSADEPQYVLFKVFRLTHCAGQPGPKLREGDGQAPEGFYNASADSMRPETKHHLGIDLGFPNRYDRYHGYTGSDLMLHGGANGAGAYALSPQDMEEVYTLAEAGLEEGQKQIRISVLPFRMTDKRMDRAWKENSSSLEFWMNLKEGYDFFENVRLPPRVEIESGRYAFRLEGGRSR